MAKRIVIMAGGTGGHVFPALAVANLLLEKGWQVSWLGTQKGLESRVIPEQGIEIDFLPVAGVRGKSCLEKITAAFKLVHACMKALTILFKRKPDVVLGMGGFASGPGGLMAKVLGLPLIIHEQNRVPGTTNRYLARLATEILEAFPHSFNKKCQAKCTGNPLRKAFLDVPDDSQRMANTPIKLLIVGGSLGAKILNECVPLALKKLTNIEVWHQTGHAMEEQVNECYKDNAIKATVSAFIEDMQSAYLWADLVICRAGAMTVSEIAALGKPAIFIPLPAAIDDHQTANARYLTDANAGLLLPQKQLTPDFLAEQITLALPQLNTMGAEAKKLARLDATEVVADYCIARAKP